MAEDWKDLQERRLNEALDFWTPKWERAITNYDFYRGEHKTAEEKERLAKAERADVSWNDILAIINAATGREILSRFQPAFRGRIKRLRQLPVESFVETIGRLLSPDLMDQIKNELEDDSAGAQALTELIRWVRQGADAESEDSQTFLDTFICGWGGQEVRMDWLENPDGKIVHDTLYPWEFAIDPLSKKRNFRDRDYLFRFREVNEQDMRAMFGDKVADRMSAAATKKEVVVKSGGVESMQRLFGFHNVSGFYDVQKRTYIVTQYEYRERQKDLIEFDDPQSGKPMRLEGEDEYKRFLAERGMDEVEGLFRRPRFVYKQAMLAGEDVLREPTDAPVQGSSFNFMTCFPHRSPQGTSWFGLVDVGRDPQRWKDRFMGVMIDMVARSPKAPVHAEKGAFEDFEQAKQEITRDDSIIIYQDGAIQRGKVKFGSGPTYPRGFEPMFMFAKEGIRESMGLSQLATGQLQDPRRAPFATVNAMQQAAQMNLAQPFDSLRLFRKDTTGTDLLYIADYLEVSVIQEIIGVEHLSALPTPEGQTFGNAISKMRRYDVVTDENPRSPTAMQDILTHLTQTQLFAVLQQGGAAPPPAVLIDMFVELGLPAQMGEQWKLSMMNQGQDPNNPSGQSVEVALQQILPLLSPGVREAVQAEMTQAQQATPSAPTPTQAQPPIRGDIQ